MPTISVIIPVYKVERYLDACVASVVGQTYPDLEIILVDDGSPVRCLGGERHPHPGHPPVEWRFICGSQQRVGHLYW